MKSFFCIKLTFCIIFTSIFLSNLMIFCIYFHFLTFCFKLVKFQLLFFVFSTMIYLVNIVSHDLSSVQRNIRWDITATYVNINSSAHHAYGAFSLYTWDTPHTWWRVINTILNIHELYMGYDLNFLAEQLTLCNQIRRI